MAWSKETRIIVFIVIDVIFFLLEITVGYFAHSLALVADAFHMLNDVISLFVGLWAVRVATKRASSSEFTYGWARAELLGGFVNGVFLVALCLTIVLDAIQRFVEPQEVTQPVLVLTVGSIGLLFNILGLFVFGHGHDHGHDHDHGEHKSHDHTSAAHQADEHDIAERGHAHAHAPGEDQNQHGSGKGASLQASRDSGKDSGPKITFEENAHQHVRSGSAAYGHRQRASSSTSTGHRRRSSKSIDRLPVHPGSIRTEISLISRGAGAIDSDEEDSVEDATDSHHEGALEGTHSQPSESSALLPKAGQSSLNAKASYGTSPGHSRISHDQHAHSQPNSKSPRGGGHSHGDENIRGIFLHVLGDALGNVGVIASALIIWLTPWLFRYYFDPAISLLITLIILKSAIPLCLDTARPLLQAVPSHVSVVAIQRDITSIPGVRSCHDVHVWALTPSKLIATLDVELTFDFEGKNAAEYMKLAREIKSCLHGHGIHSSTIQPEFCTSPGHGHPAVVAVDGGHSTGSSVLTAVQSTDPEYVITDDHSGSQCGDGQCLLNCNNDCATGKQCCTTEGQENSHHENEHDHDHSH